MSTMSVSGGAGGAGGGAGAAFDASTQAAATRGLSDYQATVRQLQGAADVLFTGESRYLSEPALYPHEMLISLRMLQLLELAYSGAGANKPDNKN